MLCLGASIFVWSKNYKNSDSYIFTNIYKTKLWGEGSGNGSDPNNAAPYLKILQSYFDNPKIKTVLDLGSGDWRLMKEINIPSDKFYKGIDLVSEVINNANSKYKKSNVRFEQISELEDIKNEKADLLIIKDVMPHWSYERITYFIKNILPNFKYALITNDYDQNLHDIKTGDHRPFDIEDNIFHIKNDLKLILEYKALPDSETPKRVYLYTNPNSIN